MITSATSSLLTTVLSTITHCWVEEHETPASPELARSTLSNVQADAPPVGLVLVMALPAVSMATHRWSTGTRSRSEAWSSTLVLVHALAVPVGVVVVHTLPSASTAAQKVVDGQERATSESLVPAMLFRVQIRPSGLVA